MKDEATLRQKPAGMDRVRDDGKGTLFSDDSGQRRMGRHDELFLERASLPYY